MRYSAILLLAAVILPSTGDVLLPFNTPDRKNIDAVKLTAIGEFGLLRKARKGVPAHLHTGIDIKRPGTNYDNEPIYPIAEGKVISKRTDGPYAQLILEHDLNGKKIWTVYEHIAAIKVNVNDTADPSEPIARFMNKSELDQYGWQFDHFHFEVLRVKPKDAGPAESHPDRFYNSYTLICFDQTDLQTFYYHPMEFLEENMK